MKTEKKTPLNISGTPVKVSRKKYWDKLVSLTPRRYFGPSVNMHPTFSTRCFYSDALHPFPYFVYIYIIYV